jgi:hypothetical protein
LIFASKAEAELALNNANANKSDFQLIEIIEREIN